VVQAAAITFKGRLICFGNEPSWILALETADTARLMLPDEPAVQYRERARASKHSVNGSGAVSSEPARGGDLVAFLREAAQIDEDRRRADEPQRICSDKTGTLTLMEMMVVSAATADAE
jgi:hypothetical protein